MLYIMRHGKTEWNAMHKLQGRMDIPLNEEGREMAEKAREEYKNLNIDICYCSPLVRAKETAEIVLRGRNIPILPDDRLVEISFGKYEGMDFKNPDCAINVMYQSPAEYTESIGGAETFQELFARTGEFLKEIVEPRLQEGKDILIVGHGAMNASIVCQINNLPIERFWSAGLAQCKILKLK